MKRLFLGSALLMGTLCFAAHHTLTPQQKIEYGKKRIELLSAQIAAQRLLKKDTSQLEAELAIERKSLEALPSHGMPHQPQSVS